MAKKSKISDEQLIDLIEQRKTNAEIAKHFGVKQGNLYYRLKELRKNHEVLSESVPPEPEAESPKSKSKPFDLQLYDTVLIGGDRYTVIAVRDVEFDVKSQNKRQAETKTFLKQQYVTGKPSAITKKNFPPVTSYIDESLKKRKEETMEGKAATINPKFEEATKDMFKSVKVKPETTETITVKPMPDPAENEPQNRYLSDIDQIVCICKPYAGNKMIRESANNLVRLILDIGVDLDLAGAHYE